MARSVPEWIGKTPDAKIPARVALRVFEREGGICYLSGIKIRPGMKWELDHRIALINGGEHRESNLFPVLKDKHREKSKDDVALKSKIARVRAKNLGIRKTTRPIPSRGFPKRTEKYSRAQGRIVQVNEGE